MLGGARQQRFQSFFRSTNAFINASSAGGAAIHPREFTRFDRL
jgi:hypothetical protein